MFLFHKKIQYIILLTIIVITAFLRLWHLDSAPYGVNNDEAAYIYSAYSIWKTGGHDVDGKFLPLSVNVDGNDLSPVPVYITAPFVGILGISPFTGRLPFALMSIGSGILVYLLAKFLLKRDFVALSSSFVFAISPWNVLLSRGAVDGTVALFFYLLAFYIFIIKVKKGNINWSIPFFLFAFYSYHATQVLFLFLIPVLLLFYKSDLLKRKKEILFFSVGVVIILSSFYYVAKTQAVIRQNVLLWNDPDNIASLTKSVDFNREKSGAPVLLKNIYSNKLLFLSREMAEYYLGAFSPRHLFILGDPIIINGYNTFFWGELYIIELPLLLCGIFFLLSDKKNYESRIILFIILISVIPSAIAANKAYIIRSIYMIPFLSITIGSGIYYLYTFWQKKNIIIRFFSIFVFVGIYIFLISQFLYQYFFQFTIFGGEYWFKSSRDLSYLIRERQNKYSKVYVISREKIFLLKYSLYNNIDPKVIQAVWNNNSQIVTNVIFSKDCFHHNNDDPNIFLDKNVMYIAPDDCHVGYVPAMKITDAIEPRRTIWNIYEKK